MNDANPLFENETAIQDSLRRIATRLAELDIPYAVTGAMALAHHGYRRPTEDIDILVTRDGLDQIHRKLDGSGYGRALDRSKDLRDDQTQVRIKFLVFGEYPGSGDPGPIQLPDPDSVSVQSGGVKYITMHTLIELKLAADLIGRGRAKDSADVQQLIKLRKLNKQNATWLNTAVRDKFRELCDAAS